MTWLNKKTGKTKGKGKASDCCFIVLDDIPDEQMDKYLESEEDEYPRLVLFFKSGRFFEAKVVSDGVVVHTQADNIAYALIILLGCYYVFNIEYPRVYSQFLGFLQVIVAGERWTGNKGQGFVQTLDLVQKEMEKGHYDGTGKQK